MANKLHALIFLYFYFRENSTSKNRAARIFNDIMTMFVDNYDKRHTETVQLVSLSRVFMVKT